MSRNNFEKPQLKSVSIFFRFVHPCFFLHLPCYLYLLLSGCFNVSVILVAVSSFQVPIDFVTHPPKLGPQITLTIHSM